MEIGIFNTYSKVRMWLQWFPLINKTSNIFSSTTLYKPLLIGSYWRNKCVVAGSHAIVVPTGICHVKYSKVVSAMANGRLYQGYSTTVVRIVHCIYTLGQGGGGEQWKKERWGGGEATGGTIGRHVEYICLGPPVLYTVRNILHQHLSQQSVCMATMVDIVIYGKY